MTFSSQLRSILSAAAVVLLAASIGWAADAAGHGEAAGHTESTGHAEAAGHGGAAHGAGGIKEDLPFWGIVAFIGFVIALKKLGWDSLTSGMRDREANENRLILEAEQLQAATAEQLRVNKGKMEALDELVRQTLAEAQRDADSTRKDIRQLGEQEAVLARRRAEVEIERLRGQSLNDLFAAAADRIASEAEARIKRSLSPSAQQKLIDAAVSEFAAQKA